MSRYAPKITTNDEEILDAINDYHPITFHTSRKLWREYHTMAYVKIGPIKALESQYNRIVKDHGIKIAEHFRSRLVGSRTKYYGYRRAKSRFGETYVDRYFQGGVKSCDNAEAKEFYNKMAETSMGEVIEAINNGDLEEAKKIKRKHVQSGALL